MTDIGLWTARFANDGRLTVWHLIESEITNRVVTRCGRKLRRALGSRRLAMANDTTGPKCHYCLPIEARRDIDEAHQDDPDEEGETA